MPTVASGQTYAHAFQNRVGARAVFVTSGPATEVSGQPHDENGDAFLDAVEMPDGITYTQFYTPIAVHQFQYVANDGQNQSVWGGTHITEGRQGRKWLGDMVDDGAISTVSAADAAAYADLMRAIFANRNLNSYVDMGASNPDFKFMSVITHPDHLDIVHQQYD